MIALIESPDTLVVPRSLTPPGSAPFLPTLAEERWADATSPLHDLYLVDGEGDPFDLRLFTISAFDHWHAEAAPEPTEADWREFGEWSDSLGHDN